MPGTKSLSRREAGSSDLRQSLARQIHDGPLQELASCVLRLETFRFASDSGEMQTAISDVEEGVRAAVASLRRIIDDLGAGPAAEIAVSTPPLRR